MSEDPVVVGALFCLALLLGIWTGHVLTFRTAYFFRMYREDEGEEP